MIHSPMPGLHMVVLWQSLAIARKQLPLFKRCTLLVQMCTATRRHSSNSVVGWWHLDCISDPPYPRIKCIDRYAAYSIVYCMHRCTLHTTLYTACIAVRWPPKFSWSNGCCASLHKHVLQSYGAFVVPSHAQMPEMHSPSKLCLCLQQSNACVPISCSAAATDTHPGPH